mgnify:CR=1 FL=1
MNKSTRELEMSSYNWKHYLNPFTNLKTIDAKLSAMGGMADVALMGKTVSLASDRIEQI